MQHLVIGIDEVGRGPLAGPVIAAAVALGPQAPAGLNDSKRLSARARARLEPLIHASCPCALGEASVAEIDALNIFAATMLAMTRAMTALAARLPGTIGEVRIDGPHTPAGRTPGWVWPARGIVGGDASDPAIAAASIIAKEHRDRLMREGAAQWPGYGWERNAGYGTAAHLAALRALGPTPWHRRSFAPVRAVLVS